MTTDHSGDKLPPDLAAEIHELERLYGFTFEFRFGGCVSASIHAPGDPDYAEPQAPFYGETEPDKLIPDTDHHPTAYPAQDGGYSGPLQWTSKAWMVRVRHLTPGRSTPFGWPAPTLQRCAEYVIHELGLELERIRAD